MTFMKAPMCSEKAVVEGTSAATHDAPWGTLQATTRRCDSRTRP